MKRNEFYIILVVILVLVVILFYNLASKPNHSNYSYQLRNSNALVVSITPIQDGSNCAMLNNITHNGVLYNHLVECNLDNIITIVKKD